VASENDTPNESLRTPAAEEHTVETAEGSTPPEDGSLSSIELEREYAWGGSLSCTPESSCFVEVYEERFASMDVTTSVSSRGELEIVLVLVITSVIMSS
jgi:hypothetical protein